MLFSHLLWSEVIPLVTRRTKLICGWLLVLAATLPIVLLRTKRYLLPDTYWDARVDPSDYGATLNGWKATGLVTSFPPMIPANAKNVAISAWNGPISWLQLRVELGPAAMLKAQEFAQQLAAHVYIGGPDYGFRDSITSEADWPVPNNHVNDSPKVCWFAGSYKLYMIKAIDLGRGSWDPHESCGIAISQVEGRVVYWAEK